MFTALRYKFTLFVLNRCRHSQGKADDELQTAINFSRITLLHRPNQSLSKLFDTLQWATLIVFPFYSILTHQNCDLTNHHGMQFRLAPHINEMFDVNLGEVGLDLCFDVVVNGFELPV